MAPLSVAILALAAPLTLAKPLSHSQRTSNTFTNTTLEDMPATDMPAPTGTDSGLGCFETYIPLPDETCGELAADYGIYLSTFEADYAADSDFCETMLSGQGFCASREDGEEDGFDGTTVVYADATVTLDDQGNPAVPAMTPASRDEPEPSVTETTITFSAMTTLTYTIGTEGARQERTKVITHTDVQVETFSLLRAVGTGEPSVASAGTVTRQLNPTAAASVSTVTVHDIETSTTTVLTDNTRLANASSTLTALSVLKGTPFATTRAAPAATLNAEKAYKSYNGNGTEAEGWPSADDWLSFEDLFAANEETIAASCDTFDVPRNSADETAAIHESILDVANSTGVDSRFILAMIMQSSSGCVRATSTQASFLAAGLLASPNGQNTCSQSASMLTALSAPPQNEDPNAITNTTAPLPSALDAPCPPQTIHQMVLDGTNGTATSDGLAQLLAKPNPSSPSSRDLDSSLDSDFTSSPSSSDLDVSHFYRAARYFNGGRVDDTGDLGMGCCVRSFASDVANRLVGWVAGLKEREGESEWEFVERE